MPSCDGLAAKVAVLRVSSIASPSCDLIVARTVTV